jgi:hypothetical protein
LSRITSQACVSGEKRVLGTHGKKHRWPRFRWALPMRFPMPISGKRAIAKQPILLDKNSANRPYPAPFRAAAHGAVRRALYRFLLFTERAGVQDRHHAAHPDDRRQHGISRRGRRAGSRGTVLAAPTCRRSQAHLAGDRVRYRHFDDAAPGRGDQRRRGSAPDAGLRDHELRIDHQRSRCRRDGGVGSLDARLRSDAPHRRRDLQPNEVGRPWFDHHYRKRGSARSAIRARARAIFSTAHRAATPFLLVDSCYSGRRRGARHRWRNGGSYDSQKLLQLACRKVCHINEIL